MIFFQRRLLESKDEIKSCLINFLKGVFFQRQGLILFLSVKLKCFEEYFERHMGEKLMVVRSKFFKIIFGSTALGYSSLAQ